MGYLLNSGSGFLKDAVNVASDVKTYLINKGGYLYDTIRIGINDYGQRVLDDSGTIEGSSSAAASYKEITKTIFDASSLVLFPSGYKESKVYSHKPIDGSGDFTYTRGTDTATRVNDQGLIEKGSDGLTESMPRIDHLGGTASLLLEPQRTNQIVDSEDFSTANWEVRSYTLQNNIAVSPEGVSNATKIIPNNGTTNFRIRTSTVLNSSGDVFDSVFAKYIKGEFQYIVLASTNPQQRYVFDVKNGTKVGSIGNTAINNENTIVESYGNGWYRLGIRRSQPGNGKFEIYFSDDGTDVTATGDGSKGMYVWGAQIEQGATYPTSYIPTYNASATRAADVTSVTNVSDLIGQTEGTIYCEFEYNGAEDTSVYNRIIGLGTGVTQNRIVLAKNDTTAELVAFAVSGGTNQIFQTISGTSIIGHHKVAISYKANEYKVYLDGELEFTDTSASVPTTTDVYVGTAEDSSPDKELGGVVKQSIIFKEVLSEDDCKALTAL